MILSLYRLLTTLGSPLITRFLKKRLRAGKEHPTRFPERLGQAGKSRPPGKLVWFHGASVGEAVSLLPLLERLQTTCPDFSILLTTGTVTSAALMEKRLPKTIIHQFIPVDRLAYVRPFLDHWKPDIAIWAESELWPNMICEAKVRNIPMALINARMSEKSLKTWTRFSGTIKELLSPFALCLAQTETDAQRYRLLGAKEVQYLGNLKDASPALPVDHNDLSHLKTIFSNHTIWLAASTHPGEEVLFARVHQELKKQFPELLTLIAPRHPERGPQITQELRALNLNVAQRSLNTLPHKDCDIYLCDTLGEMGLFYRLSPLTFMGKSLEPLGGQNPLEPARLGSAILCGPYMTNFAEIMSRFERQDALKIVSNEQEVIAALTHFLTHEEDRSAMAQRAQDIACGQEKVLDHILEALTPLLHKKGA